jgi:hypothetical protein
MSSIDERNESRAGRFFDEVIAPLGDNLRQQGIMLADVAPTRPADSYYMPVAPLSKADFEGPIGVKGDELANALIRVWSGRPFLHALARQLAQLGAELEPPPPQASDVSPFIYVMF